MIKFKRNIDTKKATLFKVSVQCSIVRFFKFLFIKLNSFFLPDFVNELVQ